MNRWSSNSWRFDLLIHDGGQLFRRLPDAAFNGGHPRFWGELALFGSGQSGSLREDDVDLARASRAAAVYRDIQSNERTDRNTFGGEHQDALTGSLAPAEFGEAILLPIGVPATLPGAEPMAGAHLAGHDGLDRFDAALLLDERLTSTGAGGLMVEAEHLHYQLNQRLGGLHALTFVDEIGLLGVPDAVHRGWTKPSGVPVTPQDPRDARAAITPDWFLRLRRPACHHAHQTSPRPARRRHGRIDLWDRLLGHRSHTRGAFWLARG